jgi:hypothetical protein
MRLNTYNIFAIMLCVIKQVNNKYIIGFYRTINIFVLTFECQNCNLKMGALVILALI